MDLRRVLSCILLSLFLILLVIGSVGATTHEFIIQPKQEVTIDTPTLTSPDRVIGNISVQEGFVDFYVTTPTGKILFYYNQTDDSNFNFTASDPGNYTFHLVNSLSVENVSVRLNYSIHFEVVFEEKIWHTVETWSGTMTSPSPLPPAPQDLQESKNLYEKYLQDYLNFLEAKRIINMIRNAWSYIPLQSIIGMIGICTLTLLAVSVYYGITPRLRAQKNKGF